MEVSYEQKFHFEAYQRSYQICKRYYFEKGSVGRKLLTSDSRSPSPRMPWHPALRFDKSLGNQHR